ncbi:MAG: hypothetical protein ABIJ48_07380 [Actinomycetota bacterium]
MDDSPHPPTSPAGSPPANPWDIGGAHEDALRELLRSPLDEESRRARGTARPGRRAAAVLFLAGAAAGAGLTVAGASLVDGEAAPATTTAAATTTTAPVFSGAALPAGYYPLGEGFGARVERILQRPDALFVTLSLAVDEEHDPAATTGHQGGQWLLEFPDGASVRSSGVVFDPVARGTATIAFPPFDHDLNEAGLRLVTVEALHTETFSATVAGTVAALPSEGTLRLALEPTAFALDGGGTLRLGPLDLAPTGASLEWTVEGPGVTGHVHPGIVLEGPTTTVVLILDNPFHPFRNRVLSVPPPTLGASGRAALISQDPTHRDPGTDFTVTATFEVTWSISAPADVTIPLGGAPVVAVGAAG